MSQISKLRRLLRHQCTYGSIYHGELLSEASGGGNWPWVSRLTRCSCGKLYVWGLEDGPPMRVTEQEAADMIARREAA